MGKKSSTRKHYKNHYHIRKQIMTPVPMPARIKKATKQVHFPENDEDLVDVMEFDDDEESQATRGSYWEIFARDRCRFKDRIQQSEEALNVVLDPTHRQKVFEGLTQRAEEMATSD